MIDEHNKAMELVSKMEAQLPIPARPTTAFERFMKEQNVRSPQQMQIKHVFYGGDDGGIMCDVTVPDAKEAIVCSITQLHVSRSHPLGQEIRAYQEERKRRLALMGGLRGPASFTVAPRKKR